MKLNDLFSGDVKSTLETDCDMTEFKPHTDSEGNICSIEIKYVPKEYKEPKDTMHNRKFGV